MITDPIDRRLRGFLLALAALAFVTTLLELWLENHFKEPLQLVPWAVCVAGLAALAGLALRPGRATLLAARAVMLVAIAGGALGVIVHLKENISFQLDIHPGLAVTDVLGAALKGAAPLLAPGSLAFAALVALAATYQHPLVRPATP